MRGSAGDGGAGRRTSRLLVTVAVLVGMAGLAVTALVGARLAEQPGVYYASQRVGILAPQSADNPNTFQLSLRGINMTAGMVAQLVSEERRAARPVEPEMPLSNVGITSGWSVEQPDRGGQWSHQYSDPYVTIQVVDPDPDRVEALMAQLEAEVKTTIVEIQDDADVAPVNRFTTTTNPPTVNVFHQAGSPSRAVAGTALLGVGLTMIFVHGILLLARRRMVLGS